MKNVMIFSMLIMMAFTSTTKIYANGGNDNSSAPLSVKSIAAGKYLVQYNSETTENLNLKIYDENGKQLDSKMIKKGRAFNITYDLNNLPEGKYKVKLYSGSVYYTTDINHVKNTASFFKANFNAEEGNKKINVRVVRHDMKPVTITIQDKNNQVIFTESISVDFNFERTYNLKHYSSRAKYITVNSGLNSVNHVVQ